MPAAEKSALERLRAGEPVFGAIQLLPLAATAELALWCGYDFMVIDCEHGVMDEPAQVATLQVLARSAAFCGVRVRAGDLAAVGRYLDLGADAILMPDVQTPEEAVSFVQSAQFGRAGTRSSTGASRATRFGLSRGPDGAAPLLLALVESLRAVEQIGDIAVTAGLDGLVIGPSDLSADLGCPDDFANSTYLKAFADVEAAAVKRGLILGSRPHAGFPVERLIEQGHRFLIVSADVTALRDGFRSHLAQAGR